MPDRPRILSGHKQIGKRFVTPFNQLELVKETRYVERIMPELLWMDMINATLGFREGIKATMSLCSTVRDVTATSEFTNFTVASKFATVLDVDRDRVREAMRKSDVLTAVSTALSPLRRNYPAFPMSWLLLDVNNDAKADLDRISASVERIIDKYSHPASIAQANVLVFRGMSGMLHYAEHIPVPDFNAMAEDPNSEQGQRSAAQARMGAMMEIVRDENDHWPRAFWNENYRLSKCTLPGDGA